MDTDVVVFAAGSLAGAFTDIGARYQADSQGGKAICTFASADHLRERLQRGNRADVFASANRLELERAREDGLIEGSIHVFAHNRLRIIVGRTSRHRIESLVDLARPGIRLAVEHAGAPLSGYTRALLERAQADPSYGGDFAACVENNSVVQVATVRELVVRVSEGAADAGIVYVTDVTPNVRANLSIVDVPDHLNVTANYAIGCVGPNARPGGPRPGQALVALVRSSAGQSILERWGFIRGTELSSIREENTQ